MIVHRIEPSKGGKEKLRVCVYARVSTDHIMQARSFENQVETYIRMIKENPDYDFVGAYADLGISGRTEKRPEFQRMIADAKAGKIDLIITKSASRFARNTVTLLKYVRLLKELGVAVYFDNDRINTLSAEGEMMLSVLASFAQEESRSIGENYKWTIRKKFENGIGAVNTKRFLGYDKDEGGKLVINEEEAKVVRRIFDMYLAGNGCFRIKNALNKDKVPTVTGSLWTAETIMGILTNEKYKGDILLQKTYIPEGKNSTVLNKGKLPQYYVADDHEAIISKEDWEYAQELIAYNRDQKGIEKDSDKYQSRYPNSGMLKCPYCGATLKRRHVYGGKIAWLCSTYVNKGKQACQGIKIFDTELEGKVFAEPTVVEEVVIDGSKHYRYTSKAEYDTGRRNDDTPKEESSSVLPRINRSRRTVIKL